MARRLLIAGGGTGGHLFPGMAVAAEFQARDPENRVLFVGTLKGIEARLVPEAGYEFAAIRSRGIAGLGMTGKLKGLMALPLSLLDALRVVRRFKPHAALGVGGYVSGPAILTARILGVPCAIHEQNAVPGFANRLLGRVVKKVFVSFDPARAWFGGADRQGRLVVTGNPARRNIVEALLARPEGQEPAGPEAPVRVLVVGGSQGAHGLNLLLLEAAVAMAESERQRLLIRHQSGEKDLALVEAGYGATGMRATVEPFIRDMASAYLEADLVVSRAGAGAVAEIALAGLPALLVPYPHAASDHQAANAAVLVDAGAAYLFREGEANGKVVAAALLGLVNDPARRREMAARARSAARPRAAAEIVDQCVAMMV